MKEQHETRILPVHYAAYLINGDTSGYMYDEIVELDHYLQQEGLGACLNAAVDDVYFKHSNDLNKMGASVCEFTFLTLKDLTP